MTENLRDELIDYRVHLSEVYNDSSDLFEKQLSYISAGALGLSFILVEKVVDISKSHNKALLISGWILLAVTLLLNLISHLYANYLHSKNLSYLNDCLSSNEALKKYDNNVIDNRRKKIESINIVSVATLIAGIGLIVSFTSVNVVGKNHSDDKFDHKDSKNIIINNF